MSKSRILSKSLQASLQEDYDPEDENTPNQDSDDSESQDSGDELNGTEHYTNVGKSKLRKPQEVALGPQYAGSRISRQKLLEDESDDDVHMGDSADEADAAEQFADPDELDFELDDEDGEIDSDDALGDSDLEKFEKFTFRGSSKPKSSNGVKNKRPTAADYMSDSGDEIGNSDQSDKVPDEDTGDNESGDSDGMLGSSDDERSEDDDQSMSEGEGSESGSDGEAEGAEASSRAELKKMMSEEHKRVVDTISQAAKADAAKGAAVKQQRKTFDSFLNVRIRLQKGLVATNSISALNGDEDDQTAPYQAAEEAAIKLWNTLDKMRHSLAKSDESPKTGQKRKRDIGIDTPSQTIWERMESLEAESVEVRKATLERWSNKISRSTAAPITGKLKNTTSQRTIIDVLGDQLSNTERLLKKTRMPRSCAPVQLAQKVKEDANIFDDADFYQLLLKELVDQRMGDAVGGAEVERAPQMTEEMKRLRKANKEKNFEENKASKGRKQRFTVHEKLQNFMAPEDRGQWEPDAVDRFFSTLLGQKNNLGEDEASDEEADVKLDGEERLMLFRS